MSEAESEPAMPHHLLSRFEYNAVCVNGRYPWGHFAFGSHRVAWCNVCDSQITTWTQSAYIEGLPRATRTKVNDHLTGCGVQR